MDTSFLFSEYRRRVLSLLLLHADTPYHVREIARLTNTVVGTVHKELSKLAKAGVLIRNLSGNQVYYQANTNYPLHTELANILRKTSGLVDILANALAPLAEKIDAAFVFGSMAKSTESSTSDVDVLVIGNISFAETVSTLYPAQAILGREINPKVYHRNEWKKLLKNKDAFVQDILEKPKLFIIGTVHDLR